MNISAKDREVLRAMAARQMELANSDAMKRLYHEWELFGGFQAGARPMIRIELGTFEKDIVPPLMRCEGEEARKIERMLHANVVNHLLFQDDTLVQDHIGVPMQGYFTPFGLQVKRQNTDAQNGGGLGHHFISQIVDLEEDFHLLGPSVFGVDPEGTQQRIDDLNGIFGDILPVRRENNCAYACPMQNIIHIMDMQDMYVAMYDYPELFHKMLGMLTDDYVKWYELMERENVLMPTTKAQHLAQGSYCFTDDLPQSGDHLKLKDIWLYMDSQETSGVSPDMYREFVVPHYKKISDRFGLLSYGCCEAVHDIWKNGVDQYSNVRKVSISPWCDENFMGEALRGQKIVYLRKPTPNLIGVGSALDEDAVRACIKDTAVAARGCTLEIAQRDVYEINNTPDKVRRYVQLIRETVEAYHQ